MKKNNLRRIAIFLSFLIITIPIVYAAELKLTYDANGNLITGDGKYRVYNSLNQLSKIYNGSDASVLLEELTYHPVEERILMKKIYNADSSLKEIVYYVDKNFVRVVNSSGTFDTVYVYHEGQLVAEKKSDGTKIFIHGNNEGSSSVVINMNGSIIENTTYSPFGEILTGGSATRYGYESKESDSVLGDIDFNFRKYNPQLQIFTQPDTLIQNVYDPQSLNRYMFERGNAYKNTDETGHEPVTIAGILYGAWKVWGLSLIVLPLVKKANEGTLEVKDITSTLAMESAQSLLPGLGDVMTVRSTYHLVKSTLSRARDRIEQFIKNIAITPLKLKVDILKVPVPSKSESSSQKLHKASDSKYGADSEGNEVKPGTTKGTWL